MKSNSEYLDDYFDKYNDLKAKGELWRMRCSPEEFLKMLDKIRAYATTG